ncbi:MAG: hypothetical protein KZQ83_04545 [gamma proteobacterium symbiont of Taylorina sp.]|nr:hypothetical protein [gamma proteobacterium symbiont of Taylorina sp.]
MNKFILILCGGFFLLLSACDSGGKYAAFDDEKIRMEHLNCQKLDNSKMSPARGVACNNYDKECQRRKKNGNNVCAI